MRRKVRDPSHVKPAATLVREDILKLDPPLFLFDYTPSQWAKIRATLSTRATPWLRPLTLEKVCRDLRVIACCYRFRRANHERSLRWTDHLNQQWLTVAEAAISIVDNIDIFPVPPEEAADRIACLEQARTILRIARKRLRGDLDVDPWRLLPHGVLPAEIYQKMEERLDGSAAKTRSGGNTDVDFQDCMPLPEYVKAVARCFKVRRRNTGLDPKERYLFEVLDIWMACGGEAKIISDPYIDKSTDRARRIKGKLAQFFAAVTVPVCGGTADSLSGKRGILARYRQHRKQQGH